MTSHQQDNCMLKCTSVFEFLYKKCLPADGSCGPKHVAVCCDVTLLCFVGRHIVVCLCLFVY
jgi:hypothetical protein